MFSDPGFARAVGADVVPFRVSNKDDIWGAYSFITDAPNTVRYPSAGSLNGVLRAGPDYPQRTGTLVTDTGLAPYQNRRAYAEAINEGRAVSPVYSIEPGNLVNERSALNYASNRGGNKNGYQLSHVPNQSVIRTNLPYGDSDFVRVFNYDSSLALTPQQQAVGNWVVRRSDISQPNGSLMSPIDIKELLALPKIPSHISVLKPNRKVDASVSRAAGREHGNNFGDGGGQQWELSENLRTNPDTHKWFQQVEPLE